MYSTGLVHYYVCAFIPAGVIRDLSFSDISVSVILDMYSFTAQYFAAYLVTK